MDYTKSNLKFKVLKTLRYLKLYGLSRTLIKIAGQYHMSSKADDIQGNLWINERIVGAKSNHNGIALVGCGNFSFSNLAFYLKKRDLNFLLATFDVNLGRAISLARKYRGKFASSNFTDIITNSDIKLVFIASNHATHASYAIECIKAGKDVHIEKPTVVSYEQLELLTNASKENPTVKIYQGYNRPKSKLYFLLSQYLAVETGPLMINWFIAGHEIEDNHWYFNEEEGGRILGNLCHWSDLTLELVGYENAFPCKIKNSSPKNSKSDFVISIEFNDRSCAAITFSAKGHTFEGVREILNIHKGNLLGILRDFHSLELDILERKVFKKLLFRDHGHQKNVNYSYNGSVLNDNQGVSLQVLSATSLLTLKIKESVDKCMDLTLTKEEIQNYC